MIPLSIFSSAQNNIGGGTSDGSFRKTAYFKCPPDSAVCVGIHRIRRHKGARTKKRQAEGAEAESPCLRESPGNLPSDLRIGDRIVWHSDIGPEPGVVKWIGKLDEDNIDWTVGVEFVSFVRFCMHYRVSFELFEFEES